MNLSKIQSNPKTIFIIIGLVVVVLALAGYIIWNSFIADSDDEASNSPETSISTEDTEDKDAAENHDDDEDKDADKEPTTAPTVNAEVNVRNIQRQSDVANLWAQLETYAANNNGRWPTSAQFGRSILDKLEPVIYDADFSTALVDRTSEIKIFYLTERPADAVLEVAVLPDPDTLHIITTAQCGANELSGGNPTVGSATAKYTATDIEQDSRWAVAFIYQLEDEATARCTDNV